MTYGDVERSGRAISDARHESVARYVQWHDEQSALTMEQDGYCKETSKNARTEQLVSKLSAARWRGLLLAVQRSS